MSFSSAHKNAIMYLELPQLRLSLNLRVYYHLEPFLAGLDSARFVSRTVVGARSDQFRHILIGLFPIASDFRNHPSLPLTDSLMNGG